MQQTLIELMKFTTEHFMASIFYRSSLTTILRMTRFPDLRASFPAVRAASRSSLTSVGDVTFIYEDSLFL